MVRARDVVGASAEGRAGRHHHRHPRRAGRRLMHSPHDLSRQARRFCIGPRRRDGGCGVRHHCRFRLTVISDLLLDYRDWLRVGGGALLLYIGITAFAADPLAGTQTQRDPEDLLNDYLSTFALTITNPITILAFLAIFAGIGFAGEQATLGRAAILVLGVWLGSLVSWAVLSFGAGMVRLSFERRHLVWINRGSGGILVISGIALIGSLFFHHLV